MRNSVEKSLAERTSRGRYMKVDFSEVALGKISGRE
jgi:hypothetical protein